MKKYLLSFAVMVMGTTLLTGCLGDDSNGGDTPTEIVVTKGALVVNNGSSYQSIDGSLTFFDAMSGATEADIYKKVNGKSLGGTPNDVLVYGQKVYVVGSDENTIFVLDSRNYKELQQVSTTDLLGDAEGNMPRRIIAYEDKVYFTTYGGYVAAIDTISFSLKEKFQVGSYPEGLAVGGNTTAMLYVANSDWGMGNGDISVIDLASYRVDGSNVKLVVPNATGMTGYGYTIYTFNDVWGSTTGATYSAYNVEYDVLSSLSFNGDSAHPIIAPAAINIDPNTGNIYIASRPKDPDTGYPSYALPGFVNVYTNAGQYIGTFDTGVEPHKIEFSYGTQKIIY